MQALDWVHGFPQFKLQATLNFMFNDVMTMGACSERMQSPCLTDSCELLKACMRAHKHTHAHARAHAHARTHTHMQERAHVRACTHTHTHTHTHKPAHKHTHTHTHTHKRARTHTEVAIHSAKGFANFSASLATLPRTCLHRSEPCQVAICMLLAMINLYSSSLVHFYMHTFFHHPDISTTQFWPFSRLTHSIPIEISVGMGGIVCI
jgi:hypothetical protein